MPELPTDFLIIQIIGLVAFVLGVAAFMQREDRRLKLLLAAQSYTLALHFGLLGNNGAVVATIISGTRNLASLSAKLKKLAPVFILSYVVFGILTYEQWLDLLPVTGSIISTIGYFYLSKIPMRYCALTSTSLWIIHNAMVLSIGPFAMEIFIFIANFRTIRKLKQQALAN